MNTNNLNQLNTDLRDQWIIKSLLKLKATHILELGCGVEERLEKKITKKLSAIIYHGLDALRGNDFLKELPEKYVKNRIVILEEVIEHLQEHEVMPLIKKICDYGATHILITTPNMEFTRDALGQEIRHPDHKFEWNEMEMLCFISELKRDVVVSKIGLKHKGITPTWGLIVTC